MVLSAKALLHHVATPDVDVLAMLRYVRRDVMRETKEFQIPWDNSSLVDEFIFRSSNGQSKHPPEVSVNPPKPKPPTHDSAILLPYDIRPVLNGKPPVHACDNVAASATDPERVVVGNTMGELDWCGRRACMPRGTCAISKHPALRVSACALSAQN